MVKQEPTTSDGYGAPDDCHIQLKEEDDFQMPDFGHSSDDEPLLVHKVVSYRILSFDRIPHSMYCKL